MIRVGRYQCKRIIPHHRRCLLMPASGKNRESVKREKENASSYPFTFDKQASINDAAPENNAKLQIIEVDETRN